MDKPLYVLQDWLGHIPIRMQSTLLLGLRGPDNFRAPKVKEVTRWLRGHTFKPGSITNAKDFMYHELPMLEDKNDLHRELEWCTQHYYSHLMHAVEVVGYMHPDMRVRIQATALFRGMCSIFHLPVETRDEFELRLCTVEWPDGQPDTFEDALEQLQK